MIKQSTYQNSTTVFIIYLQLGWYFHCK